ncbi:hypothetical protein Tco_0091467 [Tanacetum coccineum]
MKNGTMPLFLDYKTFVQAIRLDYNDGKYVTLPQPEVMKAELLRVSADAVIEQLMARSGMDLKMAKLLASAAIFVKMEVMQAYYAKESPISPPTIVPLSSMLSPMFNTQEFFLLEELLPLKKRGRDRSSSSTSALPQAF